jgi:hypothetical protein
MHDLRSQAMQATQDAQDREIRTAGEKATDRADTDILRLPHTTKPGGTALDLQRWLDMCG